VWVSADGTSWQQIPPTDALKQARMDVVATNGDQILAFGTDLVDDNAVLWSSSDAVTWERLPQSFGQMRFRDAVMTDSGIVAVAVDLEINAAAFWTSTDGQTWQRVPHDDVLFAIR
jgi:hypothetical protein